MPNSANARYVLTPTQDTSESGRVILRDGSSAEARVARSNDQAALQQFFQRLSPDARQQRFFTASPPTEQVVADMCRDCDPADHCTLIIYRRHEGSESFMAVGSYSRRDGDSAEVAFAVDNSFQGKGLGTVLLERLALLAVRHGYRRLWAVTRVDNPAMRDVFRESGFAVRETARGGDIEVFLSMTPDENTVARFDVRDRVATVASLRPFFKPNAVAVVGASRDPSGIGYRTLKALIDNGFKQPIFAVNPKAEQILGLKAYPSVKDLPQQVDLAILVVPCQAVLEAVDHCAARGVRALVVITAGFAEVRGGAELQRDLVQKVRGYGMRMIGPNCLGILNADPAVSMNASFSPVFPPSGRVAMSSQSGALGLAVLAAAQRLNLGFSTFVSVGNKADVSGNDLLQYWEEDPNTDVILLYLESFGNPRRFAHIARRVSGSKPIVAIKGGRGTSGSRAASSHTAALAAKDVAVDALFNQTGVIRVDTLEEMFHLASMLGSQPLPKGNRVGIITNAGGPGILCADACESGELVIPELSAETKAKLAVFLPAAASLGNPVDMIASASPEHYRRTIETLLESTDVDAVIVICIPVGFASPTGFSRAIHEAVLAERDRGATIKPVLGCWMADPKDVPSATTGERIPVYAFPESPARVLSRVVEYANWRAQPPGILPEFDDIDVAGAREVCRKAIQEHGPGWLSAANGLALLQAMRLPVSAGGVARTSDEAAQIADRIGYPVVLKLASRTIVHKTEVGGVVLNLQNTSAVRVAFGKLQEALLRTRQLDAMDGALIQPMIRDGVEAMIGMTRDAAFGPLIAFGLGGTNVEIHKDVVFRISPLTDRDATEMIEGIRGYRLLQGFRGQPPSDVAAVRDVLLRISRLVDEIPEIRELDLNPVIVREHGQGCALVDFRFRVE